MFVDKKTNHVNMFVFPHLACRFHAIPMKNTAGYFVLMAELIVKFIWRDKRPRMANSVWEKKTI